MSVLN